MADITPFVEGGLAVRVLETGEDQDQAFRLRHAIYCQKLRWVAPRPDGRECDDYEEGSTSIGVFTDAGRITGLVRLIPPGRPFMLESDFRPLLPPGHRLAKGPDTAEITRLATLPPPSAAAGAPGVSSLLYKAIYRWACARGVRFLYLAVETRYLHRLRRRGLPCTPLAAPRRLGEGPLCVAAQLDRTALEQRTEGASESFRAWLTADAPAGPESPPWRSPARGCAPGACAWRCPYGT